MNSETAHPEARKNPIRDAYGERNVTELVQSPYTAPTWRAICDSR